MHATLIHPAHLARVLTRSGIYHLSANSLQILCELHAGAASLTMSAIARKLGVSTAAMTGLADALEAAGLISRQPSRTDRRTIWLLLTPTGTAALHDILAS